jgi:endonuclease/exonuclease/phosphatase (EEP) superfamily protein YafD
MSHHQTQIVRIANKLKLLLKQQEQLRKENERLKAAIVAKDQDLVLLKETVAQLEEKTAVLHASAGKMEGREKQDLEKKISQYIKDIDKVIAHLNG